MWTNDINELNSSTCAWRGGAWSSKSPNGAAEIDVASRRPSSGLRQMTVRQKCHTDDSKTLGSGQAESAVNEFMMDEPEIATRILGRQFDSLGSKGSIATKVFEAD